MRLLFFLLLFTAIPGLAHAEAAMQGRVEAGAYVNSYLNFTYTWPANLQPVDLGALGIHTARQPSSELLLFAARQKGASSGVILVAEKLHVPTPTSRAGFQDGSDFLSHILPGLGPQAHARVLARHHTITPDGLVIDELDYHVANEYNAGITIQIGEYLIAFKCTASSPAALEPITKSVLATRRLP